MTQPVVVGGTYDWTFTIHKDSAVWNIAGATLTLTFVAPDGTAVHYSGVILIAASGTAHYANPIGTFTVDGDWKWSLKTVQGAIVLETREGTFYVYPSAAAL